METFDDDVGKDAIIRVLSRAYAARLIRSDSPMSYEDRIKVDVMAANGFDDKMDLNFQKTLDKVQKLIIGSDPVTDAQRAQKISVNVFGKELDEESQAYLQNALEDWKQQIGERFAEQFEEWKEDYECDRANNNHQHQDDVDDLDALLSAL